MKFNIDEQTIDDLEIFTNNKSKNSVFKLFDFTKTKKGGETLKEMLGSPFSTINEINQRQQVFGYLEKVDFKLKVDEESLNFIEYYLKHKDKPEDASISSMVLNIVKQKINPSHPDFYIKRRGIDKILELIDLVKVLLVVTKDYGAPKFIIDFCQILTKLNNESNSILNQSTSSFAFEKVDFLFRNVLLNDMIEFLTYIYTLDAYLAVLECKAIKGLVFPVINESSIPKLKIDGLYHPFIKDPIKNDLKFDKNTLCFLTGGNMAGKSTFLKSVAIAFYLGHLGFPVPATKMEMTVYDGLITAINLPDNLGAGISHFYKEVLRLKDAITEIKNKKKTFIIFDELFRGTNLKDAHLASTYIINSFSKIKTSIFIVSSHLIDVAYELMDSPDIDFSQMETLMEDSVPHYTFKIKYGINNERLGMWILRKENIFETLDDVLANISNSVIKD